MSEQSVSAKENLVWMLDDLFDSREVEHMRKMLWEGGYELVVTRSESYEADYPKYAPRAKGILLQVNFPLGEEDIKGLSSCKIISVTGIGFDEFDLDAATRHGILAANVPGFCVEEVSNHAMALLLALNRHLPECQDLTRKGAWEGLDAWSIRRLKGQILGLVGLGKIGRAVARKAKAFGLAVKAYDPYLPESGRAVLDIEFLELGDLVRTADYLSLHVPLNRETQHLIGAAVFDSMKDTAYLINTSRGGVVDEQALIEALRTKKIAGAGLDVLAQEPPEVGNPLLSMPNVIVSPHSAFVSHEALIDLAAQSTRAIIDALEGRVPENVLNREVLDRHG
ncbi:MAG: C-terminal binding protein [Deltaproteobacteria bacterium]|nr:C-terminal binding protein [Deltaproteobacteria bacterium]MBW2120325.1 C-terminal binding protein [Deltaproteobacteria bacterium]